MDTIQSLKLLLIEMVIAHMLTKEKVGTGISTSRPSREPLRVFT